MKKALIALITVFFFSLSTYAQDDYSSHTVKEGETISSIARSYKITPYAIVKLNPDARSGIREGMVLIIPSAGAQPKEPKEPKTEQQETQTPEKEVERFIRHRVKKKETLFGISKKYNITIDELKRYNTRLYKEPLKKRMKLKIPRFKEVEVVEAVVDSIQPTKKYIIKPKETKWSIAHTNGITIDELQKLNPDLGEIIKVGDTLKLPIPETMNEEVEETVETPGIEYIEYEVQPKETMFSLAKRFKLTYQQMTDLNPALKDGLKSGMVLKLPKQKELMPKEVNAENFFFYEVKPKENFFRLTRKLNLTEEELKALNPSLEDGLKAGMILKLPIDRADEFDVKNSVVVEKFNLIDSIKVENKSNIVMMLPFKLKSIEVDSVRQAKKILGKRNLHTVSLDFYSGALMALEAAKDFGLSIDVKVLDTENDKTTVSRLLSTTDFSDTQAVIGPLVPGNVELVADRLRGRNIPVISPLSNKKLKPHRNVIQSVPTRELQQGHMIDFLEAKYDVQKTNIIVIADSLHLASQKKILETFPGANVVPPRKGNYIKADDVKELLIEDKENWVILETNNLGLVTSATSVLNSFIDKKDYGDLEVELEGRNIKLFTTFKGDVYNNANISNEYLANLNFHYPSVDKPDFNKNYMDFVRRYEAEYNMIPNREAARGYDVTFDVILRLAYEPDLYKVTTSIGETEYVENKFSYEQESFGGYYNKAMYIVCYDGLDIKEAILEEEK